MHWYIFGVLNVSPQITLTADELIFHKICVTYDIETTVRILEECRFYGKSAHQLLRSFAATQRRCPSLKGEPYVKCRLKKKINK